MQLKIFFYQRTSYILQQNTFIFQIKQIKKNGPIIFEFKNRMKKVANGLFMLDIFKLPKQEEGSLCGLCCTLLYPIISILLFILLFALFLIPELGGGYEKTSLQNIRIKGLTELVPVKSFTFICTSFNPCLIYTKTRERGSMPRTSSCYFSPRILQSSEKIDFNFCYDLSFYVYTTDPIVDPSYPNAVVYGLIYQTGDLTVDSQVARVLGNRKFK
jgi:hypothetical protein